MDISKFQGDIMRRIIMGMVAFGVLASAATIDTSKAMVKWTAFKTMEKVAVSGTFDDVKFKFGDVNKNGTLESQLSNATATIDLMKVNLNDDLKNQNVKQFFFSAFNKKDPIRVTFKDVFEGKNKGTILANVRMNGKTQKVPMQYEVAGGKIVAKGMIDLLQFGLDEARMSLQKGVYDLHEGMTWSQVEIGFEAPVK